MPQVICRCGHRIPITDAGDDHLVCPMCQAKLRVRRESTNVSDDYIRFYCPCGRKLKVSAEAPPTHGRCPDCGRTVPVPSKTLTSSKASFESRTEEMTPADLEHLERWATEHAERGSRVPTERGPASEPSAPAATAAAEQPADPSSRMEAGLRLCPGCGKPVHMAATVCRSCGQAVPKPG